MFVLKHPEVWGFRDFHISSRSSGLLLGSNVTLPSSGLLLRSNVTLPSSGLLLRSNVTLPSSGLQLRCAISPVILHEVCIQPQCVSHVRLHVVFLECTGPLIFMGVSVAGIWSG
jgi:hypothetical protein